MPVAISHGNLSISITPPKGRREAGVREKTVFLGEKQSAESNLDVLVTALNRVGATPRDIIAILRALKATGALKADLEVI
jgi:flagellar P-ring protein precursor FlgI